MIGAPVQTTETVQQPIKMPTPIRVPQPVGPATDEQGNVIGGSDNTIWYILGGLVLLMFFSKR